MQGETGILVKINTFNTINWFLKGKKKKKKTEGNSELQHCEENFKFVTR